MLTVTIFDRWAHFYPAARTLRTLTIYSIREKHLNFTATWFYPHNLRQNSLAKLATPRHPILLYCTIVSPENRRKIMLDNRWGQQHDSCRNGTVPIPDGTHVYTVSVYSSSAAGVGPGLSMGLGPGLRRETNVAAIREVDDSRYRQISSVPTLPPGWPFCQHC